MGMFDFVKDAGAKLFGGGAEATEKPQRDLDDVLADKEVTKALTRLVGDMGMKVDGLSIKFREGRAAVRGVAASQAEREKIVLMIGNSRGVAQVDDQLTVAESREASGGATTGRAEPGATTLCTVKPGDSLSRIAKAHYGDAMKYMVIFEANTPMLKDPNKIYPGQVLRIPALDK